MKMTFLFTKMILELMRRQLIDGIFLQADFYMNSGTAGWGISGHLRKTLNMMHGCILSTVSGFLTARHGVLKARLPRVMWMTIRDLPGMASWHTANRGAVTTGNTGYDRAAESRSHYNKCCGNSIEYWFVTCHIYFPLFTVIKRRSIKNGHLPEEKSFFSISKKNVIISTIKKCEDDNSVVIRLYEAEGENTNCDLNLSSPIRRSEKVNLIEENGRKLDSMKNRIKLNINHNVKDAVSAL